MTIRTLAATFASAALLAASATPAMAQSASAATHHKRSAANAVTRTYTDAQLTTVATALGVTSGDLKTARASVKSAIAATTTRETRSQVNTLLATALGASITADQVKAAFASLSTTAGTTGSGSSDYPSDSGSYPSDGSGHGGGCSHGGGNRGPGSTSGYPSDTSGSYPTNS